MVREGQHDVSFVQSSSGGKEEGRTQKFIQRRDTLLTGYILALEKDRE
tara:strand:- start:156 stop:299 length:144 start_codon:yes stop_codon:yes gene_type:complete